MTRGEVEAAQTETGIQTGRCKQSETEIEQLVSLLFKEEEEEENEEGEEEMV